MFNSSVDKEPNWPQANHLVQSFYRGNTRAVVRWTVCFASTMLKELTIRYSCSPRTVASRFGSKVRGQLLRSSPKRRKQFTSGTKISLYYTKAISSMSSLKRV